VVVLPSLPTAVRALLHRRTVLIVVVGVVVDGLGVVVTLDRRSASEEVVLGSGIGHGSLDGGDLGLVVVLGITSLDEGVRRGGDGAVVEEVQLGELAAGSDGEARGGGDESRDEGEEDGRGVHRRGLGLLINECGGEERVLKVEGKERL
jgi:hypothetical protein